MILSKQKVDKLLETFSNPKSISLYDNTIEKQEMKNASSFIQNYHIYGSPINYNNSLKESKVKYNRNTYNLEKSGVIDSQNNSFYQKSIIENKTLTHPLDLEIKQSLTNLRIGQNNYKKEKELNEQNKFLKSKGGMYHYNYNTYDYSQNPNLYSQNMSLNDLYPQKSYNTNYLADNGSNFYTSNINQNNVPSRVSRSIALRDIPSNPDDVIIKEIPPNYTQMMNPISSSNINFVPMNSTINNMPMPENNVSPMIEEINTDLVQNEEEPIFHNSHFEEVNGGPHQEEPFTEVNPATAGPYQVTNFNGPIKLPEGYSTNNEAEFNAIQMINNDISTWKLEIDKPNYKIYSKPFKTINEKGEDAESRMFYLDATIYCPAYEVNNQINSFELRQKWEESLKQGKLIKKEDLGNGVKIIDYYGQIKMPPLVASDRDIVVRKTIWENYNGERDACLTELHSIENPNYPPKDDPVRATLLNKSKYIKPIDDNRTKLYYASKYDLKVNMGGAAMESKGAGQIEKWFNEFLKQLK